MKRLFFALFVTSMFIFSGQAHSQVVVKVRPVRSKVVVVKPPRPGANHFWVDGHWKWNRRANQYVWVNGYWLKRKRGRVYVAGQWRKVRGGWKYVPGYWA